MPFVFYDTETSGTETSFDQILQFAAILTDDQLMELDRFEIRSQLQPHIVPSPGALAVTGVTIGQLTDPKLPSHYDMVKAIRAKLMSWSPAVFVGYNSLDFDEMLVRQALYQTLHPPYLTNTNGNSRADILPLVLALNEFEPDVLKFQMRLDGKPSFKLDILAPANGFEHLNAHDALGDVEATLHIARLIRTRARGFWDHAIRLGTKSAAIDFALSEPLRLYTEFHYNRPHHWLVAPVAVDIDYSGHVISFDLAIDPDEVRGLDDEALAKRMMASPKPMRAIKANACPMILPWAKAAGRVDTYNLGAAELRRRAGIVQEDGEFRMRLLKVHSATRKHFEPSPYVEGQIHDGFPSAADQDRMVQFQRSTWPARSALADSFEDKRLRQLATRLIFFEHSEALDAAVKTEFNVAIAKRLLTTDKVPWMTLPRAIEEADAMLDTLGGADADRVCELLEYLKARRIDAADLMERLSS
jgi:exodeoxyribonuclease-1